MACMEALDAIKPENKGEVTLTAVTASSGVADPLSLARRTDKKILIPLTSSLYVPGRIKDTQNVLVDVGTGYFVEKVGLSRFLLDLGAQAADPPRFNSQQKRPRRPTTPRFSLCGPT